MTQLTKTQLEIAADDEQMIYFIDWQAMVYCRDLLKKAAEAIE